MSAAPFAELEALANTTVFGALSNVVARLAGQDVPGIFESAYATAEVGGAGMASAVPVLAVPTSSVPSEPIGEAVAIGGVGYRIAEHQPDGSGVSRLMLEEVL